MFFRILNKTEEAIISLLLVAMTLLVFWEVILRFGFGTGVTWGQEATLHLSAWFVLFGVSYGLKVGAHIGVDAFVQLFPPAGQRLITGIAVVLSLIAGVCIASVLVMSNAAGASFDNSAAQLTGAMGS